MSESDHPIMRRPAPYLALLLALAVYLALALPQLDLPGLHNDEAAEAGLPAMQILLGQPIATFRDTGLTLGGRTYPLMVQDYIGAFNVYFVLPFFALLGPTVLALRLYTVLVGALTIVVTFGFVTSALSPRAAAFAALLLAVSPSFIFWQRQGVLTASLTLTLTMAALWVGSVWAKRGGWRWAALLGLLCGAGIYAKLLFVWIIGGMVGALVVVNIPNITDWLRPRVILSSEAAKNLKPGTLRASGAQGDKLRLYPRTPTPAELVAFALGALIGLAPLIAYNLQTGGTLLSVGGNLTTSYYGVNNLNFLPNLLTRLEHFRAALAGRDHLWYLGGSFGNPLWEWALGLAALAIVVRAILRRPFWRLSFVILLLLVFGLVQSSFTVSGLFPTHLAILAPLWPVIVAMAFETVAPIGRPQSIVPCPESGRRTWDTGPGTLDLGHRTPTGWGMRLCGGIVVTLMTLLGLGWLGARDAVVVLNYHRALSESGGQGIHSGAIYRLVDFLKEQRAESVVAMDWGIAPQVNMLTRGTIAPQEIFGYTWEPDAAFSERLSTALVEPGALFVFHHPDQTIFPRRNEFEAAVRERGWQTERLAVFSQRDGVEIFEVVRVSR